MNKYQRCFRILVYILPALLSGPTGTAQCNNTGVPLAATTTINNLNCSASDGTITVNAVGGYQNATFPNGTGYFYAITAGPLTRPPQSAPMFSALPAGTYTLTVTDCNSTMVTLPNRTVGGSAPGPLSFSAAYFRSICSNGNVVKIGPTGGRSPYTISVVSAPAGSNPVISGDTIRGLAAGALTFTITDACGSSVSPNITIPTIGTLPTFGSKVNYAACQFNSTTPSVGYGIIGGTMQLNFITDSFRIDMFFNGALAQTKPITDINVLLSASTVTLFNGFGPGAYSFRTYYKCLNAPGSGYVLLKFDSLILGNRPSVSADNTNLGVLAAVTGQYCNRYGAALSPIVSRTGNFALGTYLDFQNLPGNARILDGPDRIGETHHSNANGQYIFDTLTYGGIYQIEVTDTCGVKDTAYVGRNPPPFVPTPASPITCIPGGTAIPSVTARLPRNNFPGFLPVKYTILSGTAIPWLSSSYPIVITDSFGNQGLTQQIPGMPPGPLTFTVAYENGCGQKDTTVFSGSCSLQGHNQVSASVTQKCGNIGDITLTETGSGRLLFMYYVSGPAGNTASIVNGRVSTNTLPNQPAGTYVFRCSAATSVGSPNYIHYNNYNNGPYNESSNSYAVWSQPAFYAPLRNVVGGNLARITYPGAIDTSYLRVYDTVITVVVPPTSLATSVNAAYVCQVGGTGSVVKVKPVGVAPFNFAYSTAGAAGPYTSNSPVTDSMLNLAGVPFGAQVWVRTTDACANSSIAATTIATLNTATMSTCSGTTATLQPNPFAPGFVYELLDSVTQNVTSFTYPTVPSFVVPSGNHVFSLRYRVTNGVTVSCIADSDIVRTIYPCQVYINTPFPLPVTLADFRAGKQGCAVALSWKTGSDNGIAAFVIQQSYDGTLFRDVAKVPAHNQVSNAFYNYEISQPGAGTQYFRLKIQEDGGQESFSPTVGVADLCPDNRDIIVRPNPAQDKITISGISGRADIVLVNVFGEEVLRISDVADETEVNIANLPSGIYSVIVHQNGQRQSVRFIRN